MEAGGGATWGPSPAGPPEGSSAAPPRRRLRDRNPRLRRRVLAALLVGVLSFGGWVATSLGPVLAAPGSDSTAARTAEWARDHHLGVVVGALEKLQYALFPPRTGGKPDASTIKLLTAPGSTTRAQSSRGNGGAEGQAAVVPLHPPMATPVTPALPGEGVFRPKVSSHGQPVLQVAYARPDPLHTSYLAGVAWIDRRAATWELHPGYNDPGQLSRWNQPDLVAPSKRSRLLATLNGGFKTKEAQGGFYENGHTVGALLPGAASLVIRQDGTTTVGAWGSEVKMSSDVVAVRQNLRLLIDHGSVVADLNHHVESNWGQTIGGGAAVWRSGVGVTSRGDTVVVMGEAMTVSALATLLHDAGAVRAMQLDINPAWMSFMWYTPGHVANAPTPHKLVNFKRPADRYFSPSTRDFFALYLR